MDRIKALSEYVWKLYREATQLKDLPIGRRWFEAGVPVEEAIQWANRGYLPEEAAPMIEAGISPDMAAEADDALLAERGLIGFMEAKLQLADPGSTLLIDPDAEAEIERIERDRP